MSSADDARRLCAHKVDPARQRSKPAVDELHRFACYSASGTTSAPLLGYCDYVISCWQSCFAPSSSGPSIYYIIESSETPGMATRVTVVIVYNTSSGNGGNSGRRRRNISRPAAAFFHFGYISGVLRIYGISDSRFAHTGWWSWDIKWRPGNSGQDVESAGERRKGKTIF